jgi:cell division protein FtsA
MVRDNKNMLVGLDIGTSKIVAIVAELSPEKRLNIIGLGVQPSRGLKKGVVVNIEATMASIQRVLEEAELMADCSITEVYVGIAGSHIRSLNSSGMVAVKEKEVTQADIDRVVETAKAIAIPNDQQILHILPQEFIIDGQEDVREPLGMSGVRLEVKVHIVTGAVSAVENITKCVRRCGLEVQDVILQPLASATAVLNDDEKELGVCLMDIGGGTSDLAVFTGGAIRHTAVIPIAGDQVTNDIAMTLRTPTKDAEELKVRHGCALRQLADPNDVRGRCSPRSSSRGSRSSTRSRRPSCGAAASRSCSPPESSLPAARRCSPAWSSWERRSFTCRCAWASRLTSAGWRTWCAVPAMRPRSGCCSTGANSSCARKLRAHRAAD